MVAVVALPVAVCPMTAYVRCGSATRPASDDRTAIFDEVEASHGTSAPRSVSVMLARA